jgi:DNA segregation ATPase FtsK/SpoIIIE, S-DNA-T family
MANKRRIPAKNYSSDTILFRNILGILLMAMGVLAGASAVSLLQGSVFTAIRHIVQGLGGTLCLGVPIFIVWGGLIVLLSAYRKTSQRAFILLLLFFVFVLAILNMIYKTSTQTLMEYYAKNTDGSYFAVLQKSYAVSAAQGSSGGVLGMLVAWPLVTFIGTVGGVIILSVLCLICLLFFSRFDFIGSIRQLRDNRSVSKEERALEKSKQAHLRKIEQMQAEEEKKRQSLVTPAYMRKNAQHDAKTVVQQPDIPLEPGWQAPAPMPAQKSVRQAPQQRPHVALYDETIVQETPARKSASGTDASKMLQRMDEIRKRQSQIERQIGTEPAEPKPEPKPVAANVRIFPAVEQSVEDAPQDRYSAYKSPKKSAILEFPPSGKRLDDPKLLLPERKAQPEGKQAKPKSSAYPYPMIELLDLRQFSPPIDRQLDAESIQKLEETLASFDIPARVQRVTHGPAVTRYELGLTSSGVNVKKILSISETIALQLAANGQVRLEVPIPGTNLFGIEVPNREIARVSLAEVLTSPEMERAKGTLCIALGKDIAGRSVICDLEKMPHLLIAGQTGSGKSVCINTIINSLLYRQSPQELRMILIDPKVVELQGYNDIPHLLIPVVTDPHKAAGALAWAVQEMLDRYHKMQSKGVRNITAYNARLVGDEPALTRIVVIIDELSDLMIACKHDVEDSIIRLAQLARAAGIHVIIATQRPTVNVITGLIKANFPSRISFAVASSIDSRTILDAGGAEKLLGSGDMFYYPTGSSSPMRVQGCYVSDQEIKNVVDYIVKNSETNYDESISELIQDGDTGIPAALGGGGSDDAVDDKLEEAVEMVLSDGQASISMLQRRMKIGYARAGRLIDEMAQRGIVSQSAGSKPREVLISYDQYIARKDTLLS